MVPTIQELWKKKGGARGEEMTLNVWNSKSKGFNPELYVREAVDVFTQDVLTAEAVLWMNTQCFLSAAASAVVSSVAPG